MNQTCPHLICFLRRYAQRSPRRAVGWERGRSFRLIEGSVLPPDGVYGWVPLPYVVLKLGSRNHGPFFNWNIGHLVVFSRRFYFSSVSYGEGHVYGVFSTHA